ncbi:MAG: hypothetical protein KAJ19_00640, partial [Gammaproteobacteria bacterium]|nr:hypothetical protein [Gammaproteobacteria bacterium]
MTNSILHSIQEKWPYHWILVSLLLIALVFIIYTEATNNDYHLDDYPHIAKNPAVMVTQLGFNELLEAVQKSLLPSRPLPYITFVVDGWRGGGKPGTFQWTNISIHAMTTLLVFAFILCLLRQHYTNNKYLIWFA